MRIPHLKFIIAGAVIVAAICFLMFSGINNTMVYYYTLSELEANGPQLIGKGVRVAGHVRPGTIQKEEGSRVRFLLFEKATDRNLTVAYSGIIPDTFKDNAEVVVEGYFDPETTSLEANTLLAKCPSKYEEMGDEHPADLGQEAAAPGAVQ